MKKNEFFKKVIKMFFRRKKEMTLIIIFIIISSILGFFSPLYNAKVLTSVSNVDLEGIIKYSTIALIIYSLLNFIHSFSSRERTKIRSFISLDIQKYLYQELLTLETKNFDREGTDFFISRTTGEATGIVFNLFSVVSTITNMVSEIGALIYVFYINIYFGFYFLIMIITFIFLRKKELNLWEKRRKNIYNRRNHNNSSFSEMIRGIRDVKVLNLSRNMLQKVIKNDKDLVDLELKDDKENTKYTIITSLVGNLFDYMLLVLGVILILNKKLDGANLIIIFTYRIYISSLQYDINFLQSSAKDLKMATDHIDDILGNDKYPHEKFGNIHLEKVKGDILFKNVTFKYDNKNVLKKINFHIKPNETIGIVGKSGSGKTTIFNLLAKLYQGRDNQIFIDGVDINKLDFETIRKNISVITQNPYIFNMSIKDNIKLVNPKATNKEIIEKCKLCCLDDFVKKLPKKYNTIIGEGGVTLSGGEKQRLAIARALVKESEIILLDEATSALDNETQNYIQEAIKKVSKDYTILIIAHRLSTVINCDRIIVVDSGEIVGIGTHDELMQNNKYYKNLYEKELV